MQYAQILINSKTDELQKYFSYKIPAKLLAYIKVGSYVKIPFGSRKKTGIVVKITRKVDPSIKNKLKNISSLEYKLPVINKNQIKIAQMMSNYYLTSLGQILFFMTPKLSKRIITKSKIISHTETKAGIKNYRHYFLGNTKKKRIYQYIKLIKKSFSNKKSAVLLFDDFEANKCFIDDIKLKIKNTVVFEPNQKTTVFTKKWIKTRSKKPVLIIGTRNTIFYSPENVGLIIVDEPENYGYKEEQSIHHHIKVVSRFYAKIYNANLLFGSNFPSLDIINDKNIIKLKSSNNFIKSKIITILDNSQNQSNFITHSIKTVVKRLISNQKNVLILANNSGSASGMICNDCKDVFSCPRCERILHKRNKNSRELICPVCNYMLEIPSFCPTCRSSDLIEFGQTTEKIDKYLRDIADKKTIAILDNKNIDKSLDKLIYISSRYTLSLKNYRFDSVLIPDWDNWTSIFGGYDYYEKILKNFIDICEISKNSIYLQTINPENKYLKSLINFRFRDLCISDLKFRKKYKYPPYYEIIKMYLSDRDQKKSINILNRVRSNISNNFKNVEISEIIKEGKIRDKYHSSFILKIRKNDTNSVKRELMKKYKSIGLSQVLIDVNPINIT